MIRCENIVKKYMSVTALDDITLDIEGGNIYALLGPNGSGKSTLMKTIVGLIKPTQGKVLVDGKEMVAADRARIAYMPTEGFFFDYMTCKDVKNYYNDFFEDFNPDRFDRLLEAMDLDMNKKAKEMSSGMMAKLKIVATLSRDADLVMLDEPLNGIDIIAMDKVMDAIQNNITDRQAVIISSHLVNELEKLANKAIFIKNGKCILAGDTASIVKESGMTIADKYREIYAY